MITIKGVTNSMMDCIKMDMGLDAISCVMPTDTASLYDIILNNEVTFATFSRGFVVLIRDGNVTTMTNNEYIEIAIS